MNIGTNLVMAIMFNLIKVIVYVKKPNTYLYLLVLFKNQYN